LSAPHVRGCLLLAPQLICARPCRYIALLATLDVLLVKALSRR
jgi:hypothetical protein